MRFWLFLLPPALLAQTQAPPPEPPQNYWHFQMPKGNEKKFFFAQPSPKALVVVPDNKIQVKAPPKVCSIPLIKVLKGKLDGNLDKMAIPPPNDPFPMKYVTPLAPPCDEEKR
jgi:hypothetical protein